MPGWNLFDRPISRNFAITPSDSADLAQLTRELIVGTGGTVTCDLAKGGRFINTQLTLAAGTHKLAIKRVYSTGTAATGLVGVA